jgi:hypothetical protein
MNDFTLYQIKDDYIAFANMIAECSNEELAVIGLADCLEQIQDAFENKAINVAKVMRSLQTNAEAVKEVAKALMEKAKQIETKCDYLTIYLRENMRACDIKRITSPELTISLRKSGGRIVIDDESKIPSEYINHKEIMSVDKNRLKADLLEDHVIDGCHLDFTPTLQVK